MSEASCPPLGVIAGAGRFPFMVVEGARKAGCQVVVAGLRGLADPALRDIADEFHWVGALRPGSWVRVFSRGGVRRAIMAGYVRKTEMYGRFGVLGLIPDPMFLKLWLFDLPDRRNDTVLCAVADLLKTRGIELQDATQYCAESLAATGVLGGVKPSAGMRKDIEFGWYIAKAMGDLDIGQSIAVKDAEVVAVEAIEGTDRMIERAGQLCRKGGWTLIKVAKPEQDMRFDIPTVGPDTIENLHRNGAGALAIEAGKTVVVERERMLQAADRYRIVVMALENQRSNSGE
jgi:DUF1009 family protein